MNEFGSLLVDVTIVKHHLDQLHTRLQHLSTPQPKSLTPWFETRCCNPYHNGLYQTSADDDEDAEVFWRTWDHYTGWGPCCHDQALVQQVSISPERPQFWRGCTK
jgi:hypothetical protein